MRDELTCREEGGLLDGLETLKHSLEANHIILGAALREHSRCSVIMITLYLIRSIPAYCSPAVSCDILGRGIFKSDAEFNSCALQRKGQ